MERLGIYIFIFFFLGLTFFERVRTKGETGSLWRVLFRNIAVLLFSIAGFFFIGTDIIFPMEGQKLFGTALSIINYVEPYGDVAPGHHLTLIVDHLRQNLFCAAATLIVAAGIWELKTGAWSKWLAVALFNLMIYPLFGFAEGTHGFLGKSGLYDHAGALLNWTLPASFVLGIRLFGSGKFLPEERLHDIKGYKILPGMKHRFFMSRGIGFTMIFLVLNATTLVDHSWVMSKTLTLITASFTILFANLLMFGLFGRNQMERTSYAPPFFAVMATLVSTQACNQYDDQQAILTSAVITLAGMFYLRTAPLKIRIWDPICSLPIFLLGGIMGILMASIAKSAEFGSQILGAAICLIWGIGAGALFSVPLRLLPATIKEVEIEAPDDDPAVEPKKRIFFNKK